MKGKSQVQLLKTMCPLDCPDTCGMIAKIEDGKLVSLRGDPAHPYTRGFICRKMRFYPQRLYSRKRILYPMLRDGKKGAGKFRRISWDKALDLLADKITEVKERYGGEAILPFQYAGNMGVINRNAGYAFYHKIGASRLKETICSAAAREAWRLHLGQSAGSPPETAEEADLILAWGINVKVTNSHFWQFISQARKRGAKLLVVDPYRNATGKAADLYLPIRTGGDAGLALGSMKALLEAGKIDVQTISARTTGFAALEKYISETPWEQFSNQCGLTKKEIEEFADLLYRHPKTFLRIGVGLSRNSRGGASIRTILCLAAVLGLYDGGRGRGVLLFSKAFSGNSDVLRFPSLAENSTREINMAHLAHALTCLKPAIKLFFVYNANPVSVAPDAGMVRQGLTRDDIFTVVHEQVMTPTAKYADMLLPATTFLENRDLYAAYGHFYLGVADPVIAPLGEARSNFDFFQSLARKMGYTDRPFQQTIDERLKTYLQSLDGLPTDIPIPLNPGTYILSDRARVIDSTEDCPTHTFIFQSAEGNGIPDIPRLGSPAEFDDPDLLCRFPFKLITPPHPDLLNSTFGERYPGKAGEVLIHPTDAASYKIADGARIILRNHRGSATRMASLTTDTQRGLLVAEGLFWQNDWEKTSINDVTSQKTTDLGNGPTFHESHVGIFVVEPPGSD